MTDIMFKITLDMTKKLAPGRVMLTTCPPEVFIYDINHELELAIGHTEHAIVLDYGDDDHQYYIEYADPEYLNKLEKHILSCNP